MKHLLFFILLFASCTAPVTKERTVVPLINLDDYKEVYIVSYGDDRFHSCEDLVDVTYGINLRGDTVELLTTQRKCEEWQKTNYDINDPRAEKILKNDFKGYNKKPEL